MDRKVKPQGEAPGRERMWTLAVEGRWGYVELAQPDGPGEFGETCAFWRKVVSNLIEINSEHQYHVMPQGIQ